MEEAPENGKESPHSVHANGLIDNMEISSALWLRLMDYIIPSLFLS